MIIQNFDLNNSTLTQKSDVDPYDRDQYSSSLSATTKNLKFVL